MADDEGSRRMDLNLYLGLPRRHRAGTESDLGSDLALGSLPLSEEMSGSNNTQSYPQNHIPQQQQHDTDYTSYLQTRMQEEEQEQEEENIEVGDDNNHGIQDSTEAMVLEGSSSNNHGGEYVPYSVSYAPTAPSESLLSPDNELLEVQEENNNANVPYFPVSPTTTTNQVNNTDNIGGGLDRIQGIGTHPILARRGIDFWRGFAFNSLLSTERLTAIAADLSTVVGGMETGASNSGASASTSANPPNSHPLNAACRSSSGC